MKPTPEHVAFFQENGYLNIGPALTPAELVTARLAYDRIFAATDKPASYRNLGQQEGEAVSKGAVLQIIDMWRLDSMFEQLLHKVELLAIIEGVMGHSNIRLYHDQALFKPALHGAIVPWHQDNGYWHLEPAAAMSMWIALDDADEENGCMWVIPGSHRAGEVGHERAGHYIAQLKANAEETRAVSVPLRAGSGLLHHCRTLPMTKPNPTPRQRRAWVMHYMPADTKQNGAYLVQRPLLRGQPLVT
jgi:ectoine hydroxylase-related dioxygenase (phytanoyl-CoA dioxygenase family)